MKEIPIAARLAGPGLIFLATACGSPIKAEPTPTSTPEPTPTPTASVEPRITPTPESPLVVAASQRECSLGEMETLQLISKRFVQPLAMGRYNSDFFNSLARSSDLKIKQFMDAHRTDSVGVVDGKPVYFWALLPHLQAEPPRPELIVRPSGYPGCIPNEPASDLSFYHEISFDYRGTYPLPDEWLEESFSIGSVNFKKIRQDRLQHAARAIYVLPEDIKWTAISEPGRRGGDFIGLRGLSILPDGTLMDVRVQPHGDIKLKVTAASWQLFPRS